MEAYLDLTNWFDEQQNLFCYATTVKETAHERRNPRLVYVRLTLTYIAVAVDTMRNPQTRRVNDDGVSSWNLSRLCAT